MAISFNILNFLLEFIVDSFHFGHHEMLISFNGYLIGLNKVNQPFSSYFSTNFSFIGALPVAIMNMDHTHSSKFAAHHSSWSHRIIYGIEPRGIYLMNPIQIQSPQQVYEQLTIDAITSIPRQEIIQRYNQSPMPLTPLAIRNNQSNLFVNSRWRTMNVLGQVVNVLREDRQLNENETRNIPYRPTVTHVRIPSTCSSGILIFSRDNHQLINASDLPLRS